ncbi:MAG: imidazolonepropionase [Pseudomonadota bacterium]
MSIQQSWDTLWLNVRLATMEESIDEPYGAIHDAAIAVQDGKIAWAGKQSEVPKSRLTGQGDALQVYDGESRWVTPGLIDCHTHLVHGGNRSREFEQRLSGVSYEEISKSGCGILSTVEATRSTSERELFISASARLSYFLNEGVTGIEIKSGYGLDYETELKMLRVARQLGVEHPVDVYTTFLGAHARPQEFASNGEYMDWLCEQLLPEAVNAGLVDTIDVFCENIGFTLAETEQLFRCAAALGKPLKAHAEQLSNLGCSSLAAKYNALSVDHLEYLDQVGIEAIKASGTVACLLPGAFYFLRCEQLPPVEALRAAGVPMAVASDCNPGSSPCTSLLLMMNMACTLFGLTPEESLAGVTRNASRALGQQQSCGTICAGKRADFVLWDIDQPAELAYGMGQNPCVVVIKSGQIVLENATLGRDN